MKRFLARCYAFLRPARAEQELEREVASHLALLEEDFQRRGLSEQEARLAARRAYGGVDLAKELHREARSFLWLEQTVQDLRHAARSLSRAPGFALLAILTLALGVGVNATLFTAYNAVALRPLPVADPGRVVRLERWFEHPAIGDIQYAFSYPEYTYCRDHDAAFLNMVAGSYGLSVAARIDGPPEKLSGQLVSANYFAGLGVGAQLGRTFFPEEDQTPGGSPVIVISHAFWQHRFHGDPAVLGRTLEINGVAYTVIGVAARNFTSTAVNDPFTQFWIPLSMQAQVAPPRRWADDPTVRQIQILARLKPGVSLARAEAETSVLFRQFARTYQERDRTRTITLQYPTLMGNTEDIRFKAVVAGVMMLVGLVLLVACANIANMLLARAAMRQREIGVRLALGAGRGRMIRYLLAESLLLSFCGGLAGLLLSVWSTRLLEVVVTQMLAGTPVAAAGFTLDLSPDARVFAYAMIVSLASGALFGLAPALQFSRPNLTFDRQITHSRLRGLLLGSQVAVSTLLLITAGLFLRGLARSHEADPGFDTQRLFLLSTGFGAAHPKELLTRIVHQLQTLPEVQSVAVGGYPMMGSWTPPIIVTPSASQVPLRGRTLASCGTDTYLETLGIPLLHGRNFTAQEARTGAPVAVISESAARLFWPTEDPLGRTFQLDMDFNGKLAAFEIIGIAGDVRFANLTRIDPAHVYLTPQPGRLDGILLRAQADPRRALAAVRTGLNALDPDLLAGLWLTSVQDGPMFREKSQARIMAAFAAILAALALILAAVGIYGVMSYLVSRRVKEIGVRMALGATAAGVLRTVVLHSLRRVTVGIAAGFAGAAALSSLLHATLVFPGSTDVLYGVPFYDPATFLGLTVFLMAVAAVAGAVPSRRAIRVDPVIALRCE
jgi:predicted permease